MSPELADPPDAPEPGSGGNRTKPRELVNHAVILLPTAARWAKDPKKDEQFEIIDCHFWRLESSGIAEEGETGISWWRAREQLRERIGQYVACRPKQQDDNSITLERLSGAAREVAEKVLATLEPPAADPDDVDEWDEDSEPF